MASRSGKAKNKKIVETSLGQAPKDNEKVNIDVSHLQKPIQTSISGIKEVLSLLDSATSEVQNYISNECEILYECRVCRTIFRSLANFILHKRSYCKCKYNHLGGANNTGGYINYDPIKKNEAEKVEEKCEIIPSNVKETTSDKNLDSFGLIKASNDAKCSRKSILPVINKLIKKQEINILVENTLNEDLSSKTDNSDDDVIFISEERNNVVLQKIETSNSAVFQTLVKESPKNIRSSSSLMKAEVMEIHEILENNDAVLGSSGHISNYETNKRKMKPQYIPKQKFVCAVCNFTFSTEKTLTHHIKYKHNKTCLVYPCPDCKETFPDAWTVYRHLYKEHHRTASQVRRMRALVHSSMFPKGEEVIKKKEKSQLLGIKENEENQWMNNFERDKDLQMCGGCGKRFERKAALHSHSQMCTKRIAICNTIKENCFKNKANENKSKIADRTESASSVKILKGSAKRKSYKTTSNIFTKSDKKLIINTNEVSGPMKNNTVNSTEKEVVAEGSTKNCHAKSGNTENEYLIIKTNSNTKEDINADTKHNQNSEITITKHFENEECSKIPINNSPEIEIFTISDDESSNSDEMKSLDERQNVSPTSLEIHKTEKSDLNMLKRKRNDSSDDIKSSCVIEISDYKEYLFDDVDQCFFTKALPYMDINELKCKQCQITYLSQYQLLWHMSLHFSWFRFQCSKCPFMSFNQYDCTTHAHTTHGTPNNLMGSTVLPIPKWKVLCTAHNFLELSEDVQKNHKIGNYLNIKPDFQEIVTSGLEIQTSEEVDNENITNLISDTPHEINIECTTKDNTEITKEINLNDELPNICEKNTLIMKDHVVLSDDEGKSSSVKSSSTSPEAISKLPESTMTNNRPIRNRTKSVKTVQNDFIYDLTKVLKLNDNSIKNSKAKRMGNKFVKE